MSEIKELPVGTEVKLPFGKIVVEEAYDCNGCIFYNYGDCSDELLDLFGVCSSQFRSDKKEVIFKAYKEGEGVWL